MGLNPQSLSRDGSGFLGSDTSSSTQILMKCVKTPLSSTFSCDLNLFFVIPFIHQRYPTSPFCSVPKKPVMLRCFKCSWTKNNLKYHRKKKRNIKTDQSSMIFKLWMILKVAWAAAKFRMQKTVDTSDLAKTEGWLRARLLKAFLAANTIDEQLHCSRRVCVCVCVCCVASPEVTNIYC